VRCTLALANDLGELLLQVGYPVADDAAVLLKLCLALAAHRPLAPLPR
jgi:hypothetical protein